MGTNRWQRLWVVFTLLGAAQPALAVEECPLWLGRLFSMSGKVESQTRQDPAWKSAFIDEQYCSRDKLQTFENSQAKLKVSGETTLSVGENTGIVFSEKSEKQRSWLKVLKGLLYIRHRWPFKLDIETPFVNAGVVGTEFLVRVDEQQAEIVVLEGKVNVFNAAGKVEVNSGEAAYSIKGAAPIKRIVVNPKDAVKWALYYPPLIDYRTLTAKAGAETQTALAAYQNGDLDAALKMLDTVPFAQKDASFHLLRAGLLLSSGAVDQADSELKIATTLDPASANAEALKAIIAVARNEKDQALVAAEKAVQLDPNAADSYVALSYAKQAHFEITAAREALQKAVELAPQNALAWARLSELWLSEGDLDEAMQAAEKATALDPQLERTQTVLGFAHLMEIDIEAKTAFDRAIEYDSSAPLPRLGKGLALIREGEVEAGTEQIEYAATLDPGNALIRSYLGKAFYEQKRGMEASKELAIAKELDPKDPTPWFYDAILKQTTNRPVEALHDMQKAIELNDNRAVYRSSLLMDNDLAGKAVSLARIYDELRFDQLAINESSKSLATDPANYSAHRFLSDTFSFRQRNETSRVSELLQTQLLQPININPVQPQSSETGLNILFGTSPSEAGFNEFTPLFESDGMQFLGFGAFGNNGTHADQAVLSGVHKKLSYSLGQFHYETEGFRENNELRHNLYNLFVQTSLTSNLDLQFEYRRRETDEGDLRLNFDPEEFSTIFDRNIEIDTSRIGIRFSPNLRSQFVLSAMYRDREEKVLNSFRGAGSRTDVDLRDGYDIQAQYLYRSLSFSIVSGLNIYHFDGSRKTTFINDRTAGEISFRAKEDRSGRWYDAYIYSSINFPNRFFWTLGLSVVSFEDGQNQVVNYDRVLPKIGLHWQITDNIKFRAAAMKTAKRSLIFEQTLEPTQIAGFSQFFDDFNGTIAQRFGFGVDVNFTKSLYGGIELSRRNVDVPRIFERGDFVDSPDGMFTSIFKFESQREDLYRGYLYWKVNSQWSMLSEYKLERFRRNPSEHQFEGRDNQTIFETLPNDVWTTTIPLSIRYFNQNGFFASLGATYVRQKVGDAPDIEFEKDNDEFVVIDSSIGYRLPKRFGIISLQVKNLLDEKFRYQDVNFQTADPNTPVFIPDRTVLGRILINF